MSAIGHNNPPADIDGYDEFEPDFGRALRFALMDPKLAAELTPEQRHVGQVVGNFMPKNGKGLKLGVRKIAAATGYCKTMVAKYLIRLRIWHYLNVIAPTKKGGATTFETNISKELALDVWCEAKRKEQRQLEQVVSALEADGHATQVSALKVDTASKVSATGPDSDDEASAESVRFRGESVRKTPKSVQPKTGHTLRTLNAPNRQACAPTNVVALSAAVDVEHNTAKLAAFGSVERGRMIVDRFAKAVKKPVEEALDQLHYDGAIHGFENVRKAVDSTAAKNPDKPIAWYRKVLESEASKNPGLQPPKLSQSLPYSSDVDENAASTKKLDAALAQARKRDGIR